MNKNEKSPWNVSPERAENMEEDRVAKESVRQREVLMRTFVDTLNEYGRKTQPRNAPGQQYPPFKIFGSATGPLELEVVSLEGADTEQNIGTLHSLVEQVISLVHNTQFANESIFELHAERHTADTGEVRVRVEAVNKSAEQHQFRA